MGRKRINAERILKVLRKHGRRGSFSKIRDWYEEDYGDKISDFSIYDNLYYLEGRGLVTRKVFSKTNKYRGDIIWGLTEKYVEEELRSILIATMNEIAPIDMDLGSPFSIPAFILGSERRERNEFANLSGVAVSRFRFEVEKTIEKFDKFERGRIRLLLAKLLWADRKNIESSLAPHYEKKGLKQKITLDVEQLLESMSTEKRPSRGHITLTVMSNFPRLYDKLLPYKWNLLGYITPYLVHKHVENFNSTEKKTIGFLSQTSNQELLSKFLEEVNRISFVLMVLVGCEQVDKIILNFPYLLEEFYDWMNSLKKGKLDDRKWIFNEGLENLKRFIRVSKRSKSPHHILALAGIKRPPFSRVDENNVWGRYRVTERGKLSITLDDSQDWDLLHLYLSHPDGKSLEFYKKIYDAIDERRKQKRLKEANVKETVERVDLDELF